MYPHILPRDVRKVHFVTTLGSKSTPFSRQHLTFLPRAPASIISRSGNVE
jgi:hypothetical protein